LLDERLGLHDARFAALSDRAGQRPFLILNSTDFGAGAPFVFNQDYFSLICSDLNRYPISLATAAAGAFPFLLSDVELENLRDSSELCPAASTSAPETGPEKFAEIDRYRQQLYAYDISHAFDGPATLPSLRPHVQWLHLMDGGLVDNMGIRSAADLFTDRTIKNLVAAAPDGKIPAMLHIIVNARDNTQADMDRTQGSPSWTTVAMSVVSAPIDTTSDLSAWGIQNYIASLFAATKNPGDYPQSYRTVQIDFDLLGLDSADDDLRQRAGGSEFIKQLDVSDEQRAALEKVGHLLLTANPCFRDYVAKTHVLAPKSFGDGGGDSCTVVQPGKPTSPSGLPVLQPMHLPSLE
jgi:NTE family protein